MSIDWQSTEDGCAGGAYRIHRRGGASRRPWRLEVAAFRFSPPRPDGCVSRHSRLDVARRFAEELEVQRRIRLRIRGYQALGVLAVLVLAVAVAVPSGLGPFVVMMVACFVALKSFVNAASLRLGDVWDWASDDGRLVDPSIVDRMVDAVMAWLEGPPAWPAPAEATETRVRTIPVADFEETSPS